MNPFESSRAAWFGPPRCWTHCSGARWCSSPGGGDPGVPLSKPLTGPHLNSLLSNSDDCQQWMSFGERIPLYAAFHSCDTSHTMQRGTGLGRLVKLRASSLSVTCIFLPSFVSITSCMTHTHVYYTHQECAFLLSLYDVRINDISFPLLLYA